MRNKLSVPVLFVWSAAFFVIIGLSIFLATNFLTPASQSITTPDTSALPSPSTTPRLSTPTTATQQADPTSQPTATPELQDTPTPFTPDLLIIGTSVAGRPLEVYRFGSGNRKRLIIAGIHGGYEWNTVVLAEEIIDYLSNRPGLVPADQTLYILKSLNPDGYARSTGYSGRANDNGVDLNRNFPANWQRDWPEDGCWTYLPISGGDGPASEPETAALIAFIQENPIDSLINYHSAALGIFAGGQPPDPASLDLAESLAVVSSYPYPPINTGCKFTGQLIDWASNQGIAAVDIELSTHQAIDFEQNLAILSVFLDWKPPK